MPGSPPHYKFQLGELDGELTAFKERPLDHTVFPYVFLVTTYCQAWVNHRRVSPAVVIATGISATGHREILGLMVGDSGSKPFWTTFLRSLRARGLDNVQLVISDSHTRLPLTRARSAPVQRRPLLCHASPHADADTYAKASIATTAP